MNRADRKKQLIAQGALYRAQVMVARQFVQESLQPQVLARSALQQAALAVFSMIGKRHGMGLPALNLQTVLPLVTGAFSVLSKRKPLFKGVLRGALVAAAAAGVATLLLKKKKAARDATDDAADDDADNIADYGV